jgi:hypothetical protein
MVKRCIVYSPTGSILLNDAPEEVFIAFESWLKGRSPRTGSGSITQNPWRSVFSRLARGGVSGAGTNYPT